MPIHPLLTATLVMDTLVLSLLIGAAATAFQVVLHWGPGDTRRGQLKLQSRQEVWALATSITAWVYLASGILLIGTLTNILPGLVPGAMCGTGVLRSCAPYGQRMLLFRLLGTVGLLCWHRLEVLNRSDPLAALTPANARVLLMLLPILILGYAETLRTLTGFDIRQPVDCCTALYGRIAATGLFKPADGLTLRTGLMVFGVSTIVLPLLTLNIRPASDRAPRRATILLAVAAVWVVCSIVTLTRILAPYHYEVLHHYCPWCLFLPEHRGVGFALLLLWGLVVLEAAALWALIQTDARRPAPLPALEALVRGSRHRLLAGVLGFAGLAAGPALWWRWQFGLWLSG